MSNKKQHSLEIDTLVSETGDERTAYFSRGHHDHEEFLDAIEEEFDCRPGERIRHEWGRWVPTSPDECVGFTMWYHPAKEGARGAFPVTIVEVA